MDFQFKQVLSLGLVLLSACQGGSENLRGKSQAEAAVETPENPSSTEDANKQPVDPNQAPVIFDSNEAQPLKLAAEVDQSALPAGFMDDIFAIHKIDGGKTLLFGKSRQSWLLDESKEGVLTKLSIDISPPAGTNLLVLENKNFWLLGKSSIAFPSTVPSTDAGQLTLINLAPDLLKDPANVIRVLFAGPQRLILSTDKRANIILLEGDKARVIALDFPKVGETPLPITAAGLIQGSDSFWFLSSDRLLLLKKNGQGQGQGQWRWIITKFKVDVAGLPPESVNQVAMLIDAKDDASFTYVGRTFELAGAKIFEQKPIKLSFDNSPDPALDPAFVNNVQPLLKTSCTPCHAGYEEYATVKAKAAVFKQMIEGGTMPKGTVLTAEQIKVLTDYLTKLLTP